MTSMNFKFLKLTLVLLVGSALTQDELKMDPELYEPVVENLIDSYLPKAKSEHDAAAVHPMKMYVDVSRIRFIANYNVDALNMIYKTFLPTLNLYLQYMVYVPETPNIQTKVSSCIGATGTANIVPANTNVDFVLIMYSSTAYMSYYATCGAC